MKTRHSLENLSINQTSWEIFLDYLKTHPLLAVGVVTGTVLVSIPIAAGTAFALGALQAATGATWLAKAFIATTYTVEGAVFSVEGYKFYKSNKKENQIISIQKEEKKQLEKKIEELKIENEKLVNQVGGLENDIKKEKEKELEVQIKLDETNRQINNLRTKQNELRKEITNLELKYMETQLKESDEDEDEEDKEKKKQKKLQKIQKKN